MISKDKVLYIQSQDDHYIIGDGFHSIEAVKEYVKKHYREELLCEGELQVGSCSFNKLSSISDTILDPVQDIDTVFSGVSKHKFIIISKKCTHDLRVKSVYIPTSTITTQRYNNSVIYTDAVDFIIQVQYDSFKNIPTGRRSREVRNKFKSVFHNLTEENAFYLGYDIFDSAKKTKPPLIELYGRLHRDIPKETQFRCLLSTSCIQGYFWADSTSSCVPIYSRHDSDDLKQDYVIVFNLSEEDTEVNSISDEMMQQLQSHITEIEQETDFIVNWVGKLYFFDTAHQLCAGIKFTGDTNE